MPNKRIAHLIPSGNEFCHVSANGKLCNVRHGLTAREKLPLFDHKGKGREISRFLPKDRLVCYQLEC